MEMKTPQLQRKMSLLLHSPRQSDCRWSNHNCIINKVDECWTGLNSMSTHFQALLQDLLSLCSTDCAVNSDLFVSTDTERTHGVASLRVDGLLASELFQHLKFDKIFLGEIFSITSKKFIILRQQTFAALVNLSPDSPTQIFRQSLRIFKSRITFFDLSLPVLAGAAAAVCERKKQIANVWNLFQRVEYFDVQFHVKHVELQQMFMINLCSWRLCIESMLIQLQISTNSTLILFICDRI